MIINLLKFILLAIIQGISEVLPISSSGHLIIAQNLLGVDTSNMSIAIFLHFGSLFAVILFYYSTLKSLLLNSCNFVFKKDKSSTNKDSFRLVLMMIISIIPCGIVGLVFKDYIEKVFSTTFFIGINLLITGILLLLLTRIKGNKQINDIGVKDAIIIGLFQCIGILPGISRSGITTIGGKVRKLSDEGAINYSFLLFVPIALGTGLMEITEILTGKLVLSEQEIVLYLIGVIISFVVTYFSLKVLLKIIKKGKLFYFAYYCFAIGLLIILL